MKNLLLIILISFIFYFKGFSQETSIKLYVQDSIGQIDSVLVGLDDKATMGIDSSYGEKNIYGIPFKDLDIRAIQRDSAEFNCLFPLGTGNSNPIYFPVNVDSKVDFRPEVFEKTILHFELKIKAINYPVKIIGDFNNMANSKYDVSSIFLLDNNCNGIDMKGINPFNSNKILFEINNNSTLVIFFDRESNIQKNNFYNKFKLFPNPFSDILKIENRKLQIQNNLQVKIYNLLGQIERIEKLNPTSGNINLTHLKPGIYFLEIDDNSNNIFRQKIIKH